MPAINQNKVTVSAKRVKKVKFSRFVGERERKSWIKIKKEKNDNYPFSMDHCVT